MGICVKDVHIGGFPEGKKFRQYAQSANLPIGIKREAKNMDYEKVQIVAQLIQSMQEAEKKLENYYKKKDIENFNNAKKSILKFQKEIKEMIE